MQIKRLFTVAALSALASAAQAAWCEFQFTGTVDYGLPQAPKGALVTGTFSYNTRGELPPSAVEETTAALEEKAAASGAGHYHYPRSMSLQVNGHVVSASQTFVDVVNNFGGNIEDAVSVYGLPMTFDGQAYPDGSFGLQLASGPGKVHVLHNIKPPRHIDVSRYTGMNYGWVQVDGSGNGSLVSFVVNQVVTKRCH